MSAIASAPGKLMIAGEYIVLEGAEAIVTAVDRRVYGRLSPRERVERVPPPEAKEARAQAERFLGRAAGELELRTDDLYVGSRKLGLGSSAASAAVAAALVWRFHGADIDDERRSMVFGDALKGHLAVAPQGSGADVAAACLGGTLGFAFDDDGVRHTRRLEWPSKLRLSVVWSGQPARTSDLVAKVKEHANREPIRYRQVIDAVRSAALAFVAAFERADIEGVLHATALHHRSMEELGQACGASIVEERLSRVAELARCFGGAAKPSGAGGGDVALAFFAEASQQEDFEAACRRESLDIVDMTVGAMGVRIEPDERGW